MGFKSGFIAIIGKPNVGKSSLVNVLVGEKVSIISPKAQTTRNKIFGIDNGKDYQMIFVDTPGVQHTKTKLGEYMSKATDSATVGVDAIVVVFDSLRINQEDFKILSRFEKVKCPVYVVINKIEITNYEKLYPILTKFNKYTFVKKFFTVSAKRQINIDELKTELISCLKDGPAYYPTDEYTDKSLRFMCSEIIREKALLYLQEEIPHGLAVDIVQFSEEKKLITIEANLVTENERHKQIIIGKNGEMIKQIGLFARKDIEALTGIKVMLNLFVKVSKNWKDNLSVLQSFGFSKKDI